MCSGANRNDRQDGIAPDRQNRGVSPWDHFGPQPPCQMTEDAQSEEAAYPYRPKAVGAKRENGEGKKDQDIDNENSNLN